MTYIGKENIKSEDLKVYCNTSDEYWRTKSADSDTIVYFLEIVQNGIVPDDKDRFIVNKKEVTISGNPKLTFERGKLVEINLKVNLIR